VARDATARLYDVDADNVGLEIKTGTITFRAKKGRHVDLDKLHESIWATRLSGKTGMAMNWIDVTAVGEVVLDQAQPRLKVTGSDQGFLLADDTKAARKTGEKSPFARLQEALERGEKVVSVTGRVEGWGGHFPDFLKTLPKKPRVILVKEFEVAKH
jgi:hypothetical protein